MDELTGGMTTNKTSPTNETLSNTMADYSKPSIKRATAVHSPKRDAVEEPSRDTSPLRKIQGRVQNRSEEYAATHSPVRTMTLFNKQFHATSRHNSPWRTAFSGQHRDPRFKTRVDSEATVKPPSGYATQAATEEREIGSSYRDSTSVRHYVDHYHESFRHETDMPSFEACQDVPSFDATSPGGFGTFSNDDALKSTTARSPARIPPQAYQSPYAQAYNDGHHPGNNGYPPEEAANHYTPNSYPHHPYTDVIGHTSAGAGHTGVAPSVTFSPGHPQAAHPPPDPYYQMPAANETATNETAAIYCSSPWRPTYDSALTPRAKGALETWYKRLKDLYDYKAKHGNCLVPQKYAENPSLGIWVNKQRMEHKLREDGHKSSLTDEKLAALQKVGFVWAKRRGEHSWLAKFDELRQYRDDNGDCLVPTKYPKNPALGRWVSTQRSQYKLMKQGKKSTMTKARVKKLSSIGFTWTVLTG